MELVGHWEGSPAGFGPTRCVQFTCADVDGIVDLARDYLLYGRKRS
jgi:hypothetical protein